MWAREYFVATFGQISAKRVQKYIEEQEAHHKQDNFRISEFYELTLSIRFPSLT
ncbi:MAG: transposase [Alphaproteobacteria bacterium]|nr:transposase [Alphaproteobacteria bacterium]